MSASITQLRRRTLVVTPDDLSKLDNSLRSFGGEPSYEVECSDAIKRSFTNLQELLDFENPPNKDIRLLRMKSGSPRSKSNATISFENSSLRRSNDNKENTQRSNIWIAIEGDEDKVVKLVHDLDDRLEAMKPPYSFMHSLFEPTMTILLIWFVLILSIALRSQALGLTEITVQPATAQPATAQPTAVLTVKGGVMLALLIVSPIVGILAFSRVQIQLFPIAAFTIGQGAKRHNDKWGWRNAILALFIGVVASLIASMLWLLFGL